MVMPNDDWRNQGIDILRRLLVDFDTGTIASIDAGNGAAFMFTSSSVTSIFLAEAIT